MEESFFQKVLKSPFAFIGSIILFSMIIYYGWGMTARLIALYTEKRELEKKILELQTKNEAVKKEIEYTQTAGFLEREGKARLNLKKPGEEVVVIVPEKKIQAGDGQSKQGFWKKFFSAAFSFLGF